MQTRDVLAGLLGLTIVFSIVEGSTIKIFDDLTEAIKCGDTHSIRQSEPQVQAMLASDKQSCTRTVYSRELEEGRSCSVTIFDYALEHDITFAVEQCLKQEVHLAKDEYLLCPDPLKIAVMNALHAEGDKRLEATRWLLEAGADPNRTVYQTRSGKHTSLIIEAAGRGDTEMVALLLEYGAYPGVEDIEGNTAMHKAVKHCDEDLIFMIFKADKSQTKTINRQGKTPLQVVGEAWDHDEQCRRQVEKFVGALTRYAEGTRAQIRENLKNGLSKAKSWFSGGKL